MGREHQARREDAEEVGPGGATAGWRSLVASGYPALARALGDRGGGAARSGLQLQRCPDKPKSTGSSIQDYKDANNPAHDAGTSSEAAIKATSEYSTLRSSYRAPTYDEADAVLACRLAIRDLRQGQSVDLEMLEAGRHEALGPDGEDEA